MLGSRPHEPYGPIRGRHRPDDIRVGLPLTNGGRSQARQSLGRLPESVLSLHGISYHLLRRSLGLGLATGALLPGFLYLRDCGGGRQFSHSIFRCHVPSLSLSSTWQ